MVSFNFNYVCFLEENVSESFEGLKQGITLGVKLYNKLIGENTAGVNFNEIISFDSVNEFIKNFKINEYVNCDYNKKIQDLIDNNKKKNFLRKRFYDLDGFAYPLIYDIISKDNINFKKTHLFEKKGFSYIFIINSKTNNDYLGTILTDNLRNNNFYFQNHVIGITSRVKKGFNKKLVATFLGFHEFMHLIIKAIELKNPEIRHCSCIDCACADEETNNWDRWSHLKKMIDYYQLHQEFMVCNDCQKLIKESDEINVYYK